MAIRYVVAATSAPSGVLGIMLPAESIDMKELPRSLVASRLSCSGMPLILDRVL